MPIPPLSADALYTACDPAEPGFQNTAELPELDAAEIHPRAVAALHLGLDMPHADYNLFMLGDSGSGRHAIAHLATGLRLAQRSALVTLPGCRCAERSIRLILSRWPAFKRFAPMPGHTRIQLQAGLECRNAPWRW